MPPVMTVHYAGDSLYVFRDDATSADRSVYPDDGLSEGVFGSDEATFSATRYRETDEDCNGGDSAGEQRQVEHFLLTAKPTLLDHGVQRRYKLLR